MAQTWVYDNFGSQADAVSFLNLDARQGPGEACASARNDGSVGLIFLEPGSLGASTALTWVYDNFGSQADAVSFLNLDARQGPGEASTTLRGDGSVGLFFLEPGTTGGNTSPTWVSQDFASVADALAFLNGVPRLGPGQVSAMARNNGTVGMFYLEPGSLGAISTPTWAFQNFATVADALTFLNAAPSKGPGEASAFARNDGTVSLFYLQRD
jgi:hypothetical protein